MSDTTHSSSYKKLFSNTIIFAIGSFSSKVLVLFLVPIYTNYLSTSEMGVNDLITQIANWLIPVFSLTISEAIIRFGLDKAYEKKRVFTIGNGVIIFGLLVLSILMPLVYLTGVMDKYVGNNTILLYIYICTSSLRTLYSTFVRALEKVKLFAIDGLFATFMTLFWTVVLIMGMGIGIKGYLLSIILSDLASFLFLMISAKLWRYIDIKKFDRELATSMLRYSIPLIPAQVLWLLTNTCDVFMSASYLDTSATGILSAAYKIPNIVSSIYLMFGQAWNMSAITENESEHRSQFYINVFNVNQTLMYCLAGGCLLFVQLITSVWIGADFQEAVLYSPILIYAMIYICFTTFLGSVYMATKQTRKTMYTSLIAGIVNVILNIMFLKTLGLYAAALSTVASYGIVFIIRAIDARKLVGFKFNIIAFIANNIILIAMVCANYIDKWYEFPCLLILFLIIILINFKDIKKMINSLLPPLLSRFKRKKQ